MKIMIITCVYKPEPVVSAGLAYDLATRLNSLGYTVDVVCPFPSRPSGIINENFKKRIYKIYQKSNKHRVIRLGTIFSTKSSFLSRFFENISFGFSSSALLFFSKKKPDIIFLNTWPVFAAFLNIFIAKIFSIKVIRSIQDIYPETLISQKRASKKSFIIKLIDYFERFNYKKSSLNLTISHSMQNFLIAKYPEFKKPKVIHNWHNLNSSSDLKIMKRDVINSLSSKDIIYVYGGNISSASNIYGFINNFAAFSKINSNVKLLIAGDGPLYKECVSLARDLRLLDKKIFFHNPWAVIETLPILRIADVLVLPTENQQSIFSVPSKIISYMTASRAILAYGSKGSELEKVISDSGCGWFAYTTTNDEVLLGLHESYKTSKQKRKVMGKSGYEYMIENYTVEPNVKKIVKYIKKL